MNKIDPRIVAGPNPGQGSILDQVALQKYYVNVKEFGAKGDGMTDDTGALQSLLNVINSNDGKEVLFEKNKTYRVTKTLLLNDLKKTILNGNGATIIFDSLDSLCFRFLGNLEALKIINFDIKTASNRIGLVDAIGCSSGQSLVDIEVYNNTIENFKNAISLNADLSGTLRNCTIEKNTIKNTVGFEAGTGYGIHVSTHDNINNANVKIKNNVLYDTDRHAIYVARGNGFTVTGNKIFRHGLDDPAPTPNAAISLSRSKNVLCKDNFVQDSNTGGVFTWGAFEKTGYDAENITIENNTFVNINYVNAIYVGLSPTYPMSKTKNVKVINNKIFNSNPVTISGQAPGGIHIDTGINVEVKDNVVQVASTANDPVRAITLNAHNENTLTATPNSERYCDNWIIEGNIIILENKGAATYAFRLGSFFVQTSIVTRISNNSISGNLTSEFNYPSAITNPNLEVIGNLLPLSAWAAGSQPRSYPIPKLNTSSMTINNSDFSSEPIRLGVYYLWMDGLGRLKIKNSKPTTQWDGAVVGSYLESGNSRPTVSTIGFNFFDQALNKPIWWNGTVWKDASGNTV